MALCFIEKRAECVNRILSMHHEKYDHPEAQKGLSESGVRSSVVFSMTTIEEARTNR